MKIRQESFYRHIILKEKGYIYIYGGCEVVKDAHFLKLKDNDINWAKANLILFRLNANLKPARTIYRRLKELDKPETEEFLLNPTFNKLKREYCDGKA